MRFDAVLFDLDGTLLDTIEDLTDSMNAALAKLGLPPVTVAQCKYFVGDGAVNFVTRSLPADRQDKQTVEKMCDLYRQEYSRGWAVKTRPYEGIEAMLDGLAAKGLKMAVLSNKPDEFTKLMVTRMLGRWQFAAVAGERAGVPKKPDPGAAREVARQMGIGPERFLYVGDTNTDMKTANGAGMHAVGALWGFRTAQELLDNGAKVLIKHPTDLLNLL